MCLLKHHQQNLKSNKIEFSSKKMARIKNKREILSKRERERNEKKKIKEKKENVNTVVFVSI